MASKATCFILLLRYAPVAPLAAAVHLTGRPEGEVRLPVVLELTTGDDPAYFEEAVDQVTPRGRFYADTDGYFIYIFSDF